MLIKYVLIKVNWFHHKFYPTIHIVSTMVGPILEKTRKDMVKSV